jgi:hypothetical protein
MVWNPTHIFWQEQVLILFILLPPVFITSFLLALFSPRLFAHAKSETEQIEQNLPLPRRSRDTVMTRKRAIVLIVLGAASAITFAAPADAAANKARGEFFAREHCATCHAIGRNWHQPVSARSRFSHFAGEI